MKRLRHRAEGRAEAAGLRCDRAECIAGTRLVKFVQHTRRRRRTKRTKDAGGMKAAKVRRLSRTITQTRRDFEPRNDRGEDIRFARTDMCAHRQRGRHRRTAYMRCRADMRIIVIEAMRHRAINHGGRGRRGFTAQQYLRVAVGSPIHCNLAHCRLCFFVACA